MRTTPTRITNCIDRLLLQEGGSIKDWCRKHGFYEQHLIKIRRGHIEPSGWIMLRIAQAFGRPVDEIFNLMPTDDIWEPKA